MPVNLHNRDFLKEVDFTTSELQFLLDLAHDLKRAKYSGTEVQRMQGKNVALIFEKTSTRTRCAFEVAAYDQGAHVTYLDPTSSQLGHKGAPDVYRDPALFFQNTHPARDLTKIVREVFSALARSGEPGAGLVAPLMGDR